MRQRSFPSERRVRALWLAPFAFAAAALVAAVSYGGEPPAPAPSAPGGAHPAPATPAPAEVPKVEPKDLPKIFPVPLPSAAPGAEAGPEVPVPGPGGTAEGQPRPKTDPQAVGIVNAYLKAIGGVEALAAIRDRTTKFVNVKSAASGDTEVEIILYLKELGDNAFGIREEWDVKGFDIKGMPLAFTQIYNGRANEGWVVMFGTVSSLDGKTLQVFVWDKYIDDFFCHWEADGYTLTMGGQGVVPADRYGQEVPCDVVNVTDFTGRQTARYYFSRKDGLIVKKEWEESGSNSRTRSKREQYFKDYRDIGFLDDSGRSVKFPLRLEIYLDGDLDTVRRFTSVQFNSGLSDKLFEKPEGRPFDEVRKELEERDKAEKAKREGEPAAPGTHAKRRPGVPVPKEAIESPPAEPKPEEPKPPSPEPKG